MTPWFAPCCRADYPVSEERAARCLADAAQAAGMRLRRQGDAWQMLLPVSGWWRNDWNPLLCLRLRALPDGRTRLRGHFRPAWHTLLFMAGMLGFGLWRLWGHWRLPDDPPGMVAGARALLIQEDWQMLGMLLLVNALGWVFSLGRMRRLRQAVQASVEMAGADASKKIAEFE